MGLHGGHERGLDHEAPVSRPGADVIFSLLAFLMLGFYLTLLTQPSRPGVEEG